MEVDGIHSLIERKMKNKDAYTPRDFIQFTTAARKNPFPLKVTLLDNFFFRNYDKELFVKSIRPGRKAKDPKVVKLGSEVEI